MRVFGLSLLALHVARAAGRDSVPGDPQHEPVPVKAPAAAAVGSGRRGAAVNQLPRHDSAGAADQAETAHTEQMELGIELERENKREDKVEKLQQQEDPVGVRGSYAHAEPASDASDGHQMTLETPRVVETGTGEDGTGEAATPDPPPRSDRQTDDHADGTSGDGSEDEGPRLCGTNSSCGGGRSSRRTVGVDIAGNGSWDDDADVGGVGGGGGGGGPLERCYSSPAADPSDGAWKACPGGEQECSPTRAMKGNWPGKWGTGFHRCTALWASQHPRESSRPYWRWEPEKCTLEEFTAEGFCRAMEGRKGLLLVGDSLTRLFTLTLAAALGARQVSTSRFASDLFLACGDSLRVMHYRNDLLDTRVEEFPSVHCVEPDFGSTRCARFADDATLEEYDTLMVNSGAHILRGGMPAYADMMSQASLALTASMRRLHGEDAILVVRNTSPGHWNCEKFLFHGPVDMDTAANLTAQAPKLFEWETFSEKNEVLRGAFSAEGGWRLLDAYTPTVLRADGHYGLGEDCLHYCLPGPIDHWLTLLYNILLAEASGAR